MIGGFFERHHAAWDEAALAWFEALLDEDDVDVMAWALSARPAPAKYAGAQLTALQKLDYVTIELALRPLSPRAAGIPFTRPRRRDRVFARARN